MSKRAVTFTKPNEPSFLKKLKKEAGYKEGPTVDTKREDLGPAEDISDTEEEQPQVVVLQEGDLSAEEAAQEKFLHEKKAAEAPADLNTRVIFKAPAKKNPQESEGEGDHSSKKKSIKKSTNTGREGKKVKNKTLLSFDEEEEDDQGEIVDMATEEMGEIDDIHSKDEGEHILNGDVSMDDEESQSSVKKSSINSDTDQMEVDEENNEEDADDENNEQEDEMEANSVNTEDPETDETGEDTVDSTTNQKDKEQDETEEEEVEEVEKEEEEEVEKEEKITEKVEEKESKDNKVEEENGKVEEETKDNKNEKEKIEQNGDHDEIHEIIDDDDEDDDENDQDKVIELDDSGGEGDDVLIIEPKENGTIEKSKANDELEVIELDDSPMKKTKKSAACKPPTRRSTRNLNKSRSYVESDRDDDSPQPRSSEESDVEEIVPTDPLAGIDHLDIKKTLQKANSSSTIVVKDTKRLVEIAAKSNSNNSGNKKEPTLVIIDTNSILSGRGPVPVSKSNASNSNSNYPAILPMALPAQGMYPPNMRATITPIPMNNATTISKGSVTISAAPSTTSSSTPIPPLLPTLTDDMFVVEAPSFIVPYVYEKPPVKDFKEFVKDVKKEVLKNEKERKEKEKKENDKSGDDDDDEPTEIDDKNSTSSKEDAPVIDDDKKPYDYFGSPIGKFFIDIGFNLVQEFVQSDLLRQQKRKRDREGGHNPTTNKTIHSLIKTLEFSKENNEPFKIPMKKCEFCHFKTESALALAHHLETPHMKNYQYKCNFCSHEVRSPHDILFHMEAEHAVRGRLERAPAFHQCPNCPFEDNQKGKLSRHLVACMRKFKPEKNLDPPIDWEPPAKIPRVPKTRQGLNVSAYQAMKNSQLQFFSKMQLLGASGSSMQQTSRGRGRPAMSSSSSMKGQSLMRPSSGMLYKQQTLTGGSVLVPTNYQLSGNQLYQVVGQELGGRLGGHPGQMAFVPNLPSATSTIGIQNQSKNKSVHQPSISITPLPRQSSSSPSTNSTSASGALSSTSSGGSGGASATAKPGDSNSKNSFVICEICDGYIKDLEQLRNHMQWIHKVKIHPKMIYNRPPLNCQKCQFRFFTDQGLERHLLGSHGLVTSSMQDAANKSKDAGRCPVCGRVYQWKLLNHVARDHNMTLKPAHLSYKCTVCTATFGMYKQFENHVYSAHSVVAKRGAMDKKNSSGNNSNSGGGGGGSNNNKNEQQLMKPLKINDEITIIPQPAKPITNTSGSTPGTSKNADKNNSAAWSSSGGEPAPPSSTNGAT